MIVDFRKPTSDTAIDTVHNLFLFGCLLAKKPHDVLEIGIGTGYVTNAILKALDYNCRGKVTCVDNWLDFDGQEPSFVQGLRKSGATIVAPIDERNFVEDCPTDSFDVLVSDADHNQSHQWLAHHLRIVRPDGFLFFHDTNGPYEGLRSLEKAVEHLPHYHFKESSRVDEQCERGWLFVINYKSGSPPSR